MAILTAAMKNALASEYASLALFGTVYTTVPGSSAGTEPSGGSPAYARKSLSWSAPSSGAITATATFDIPAGTTVVGTGIHSAATGGSYLDGNAVISQSFTSQGTLQITFTFTQV
jgi:hypothetical protein